MEELLQELGATEHDTLVVSPAADASSSSGSTHPGCLAGAVRLEKGEAPQADAAAAEELEEAEEKEGAPPRQRLTAEEKKQQQPQRQPSTPQQAAGQLQAPGSSGTTEGPTALQLLMRKLFKRSGSGSGCAPRDAQAEPGAAQQQQQAQQQPQAPHPDQPQLKSEPGQAGDSSRKRPSGTTGDEPREGGSLQQQPDKRQRTGQQPQQEQQQQQAQQPPCKRRRKGQPAHRDDARLDWQQRAEPALAEVGGPEAAAPAQPAELGQGRQQGADVVDLTLSSDDDEEPQAGGCAAGPAGGQAAAGGGGAGTAAPAVAAPAGAGRGGAAPAAPAVPAVLVKAQQYVAVMSRLAKAGVGAEQQTAFAEHYRARPDGERAAWHARIAGAADEAAVRRAVAELLGAL